MPDLFDLRLASRRERFTDEHLNGEQAGPREPIPGLGAGPFTSVQRFHRELAHDAVPGSQAWLTEVLHRIPEHPSNRIDELLPWNCKPDSALSDAA